MSIDKNGDYRSLNLAFDMNETLSIDVSYPAGLVENSFNGFIIDHQEGLYMIGEHAPVIDVSETAIAYMSDGTQKNFYHDSMVSDKITCVTNNTGEVIINKYALLHYDKFLSFKPTVPTIGISLIRDLMDYITVTNNPYKDLLIKDMLNDKLDLSVARWEIVEASSEEDIIASYIKNVNTINTEKFISICNTVLSYVTNILDSVHMWTHSKPTYIYMSDIDNNVINIRRSMDIRAYRYEAMLEAANWSDD